ncbi:hypothetical protein [Bradyrhizobium acaciae]|uniref:hypothetical protein n=1 Tax=Bradyrhizobium acaciae TaxID=2683706 RepID=UPI001E524D41|nr:hypothetical protein [Bradyrhizobium acaciae]MCC8982259.1 hypothetical protein [Bradyrhizobium acaciae]
MSETNPPPVPPAPAQPPALPAPRSGCATAFMVVFGLVLLLPGLCALLFGIGSLTNSSLEPGLLFLTLLGLLVGFAGIMLIRAAIKGR